MDKDQSVKLETATFAGGCFWCTEAIFKRIRGVIQVQSGYTGGSMENPTYEAVANGQTGHAEAINVTFDPNVITYDRLLDVFFGTHDPTTLNRQGNDVGTDYRSAIFYHNIKQKEEAQQKINLLESEKKFQNPIVTQLNKFTTFYNAEEYHNNYYDNNKTVNPYCSIIIDPKIKKLLTNFKPLVKKEYTS